jgi:gliding motility-associated-like protein
VTVNPAPAITFTANPLIGCAPLDVTFTNTTVGASNCQWSFGNGLSSTDCSSATTTYSQPGCYDITLSATALGCISTLTVPNFICVEADPVASFNTSTGSVGVFNSVVQFSNSSVGASSYSWSFDNGNGLSTLEDPSYEFPSEPGTYNVMLLVSSPLGCTDTAFATIVVNEELIFYVPNTFTPDNDMFNQQFLPIFTSGYDPYDYSLSIYNRWGELIFESHDASVGWDGNYGSGGNFKQVQDGTYTWKIEFKVTKNDERKMAVGSVNILR